MLRIIPIVIALWVGGCSTTSDLPNGRTSTSRASERPRLILAKTSTRTQTQLKQETTGPASPQGPQGEAGPQGATGPVLVVMCDRTAIAELIVEFTRNTYLGNCACPFEHAKNGSQCGGRSAQPTQGKLDIPIERCDPDKVQAEIVKRFCGAVVRNGDIK